MTKWCCGCKENLPFEDFNKSKSHKDGLAPRCRECDSTYKKKWYKANRERQLEKQRNYNSENKEKRNAYQRERRKKDPYKADAPGRKYRASEKGKETRRARDRRYYQEKKPYYLTKAATRRGVPYTEEAKEYISIILDDPCVYCGGPSGTVDHIQPISKGGLGDWDNLAPACHSCNSGKCDRDLLQFLLHKNPRAEIGS